MHIKECFVLYLRVAFSLLDFIFVLQTIAGASLVAFRSRWLWDAAFVCIKHLCEYSGRLLLIRLHDLFLRSTRCSARAYFYTYFFNGEQVVTEHHGECP